MKKYGTVKFGSSIFAVAWLCALSAIAILGLWMVIFGTSASSANRYLSPPEVLLGLGVLYVFAVLAAFTVARQTNSIPFLTKLRQILIKKIDKSQREKLRNMFLLLTFFSVAAAMTHGTTPMYRAFATNYSASLFANLLTSIVAAFGLFGWLFSLLISKQSKEKL